MLSATNFPQPWNKVFELFTFTSYDTGRGPTPDNVKDHISSPVDGPGNKGKRQCSRSPKSDPRGSQGSGRHHQSYQRKLEENSPGSGISGNSSNWSQCGICGKCFVTEANLKQHMLLHEGKKPFKCNFCGLR